FTWHSRMPPPRQGLFDLFKARAVSFGTFTLASGKQSSYYINSKKALFHSEALALLGEALYEQTADLNVQAVGGLEVGAIPMAAAAAVAYHAHGREVEGFFVRKQPKGHGSQERVEGVLPPGARVAVLDDVLTTGGSALQTGPGGGKTGAAGAARVFIVDPLGGGRGPVSPHYQAPPPLPVPPL